MREDSGGSRLRDQADPGQQECVLAPCPFCGCEAVFDEVTDEDSPDFGGHFVRCTRCLGSLGLQYANKEDPRPLLAEKWNRRDGGNRPEPSSLADDEGASGFTPSDYAHTAKLLRSTEAVRKAAASNNHNIILAALDRCAESQTVDRMMSPGRQWLTNLASPMNQGSLGQYARALLARLEELERRDVRPDALLDVLEQCAQIAEEIYGEEATWVDQEVGSDIAKRIRALKQDAGVAGPPANEVSHPSLASAASGMLAALEAWSAYDNEPRTEDGYTNWDLLTEARESSRLAIAAARSLGIKES